MSAKLQFNFELSPSKTGAATSAPTQELFQFSAMRKEKKKRDTQSKEH